MAKKSPPNYLTKNVNRKKTSYFNKIISKMYQRKTFIQAMRTFYKFAKMIHQLNRKKQDKFPQN